VRKKQTRQLWLILFFIMAIFAPRLWNTDLGSLALRTGDLAILDNLGQLASIDTNYHDPTQIAEMVDPFEADFLMIESMGRSAKIVSAKVESTEAGSDLAGNRETDWQFSPIIPKLGNRAIAPIETKTAIQKSPLDRLMKQLAEETKDNRAAENSLADQPNDALVEPELTVVARLPQREPTIPRVQEAVVLPDSKADSRSFEHKAAEVETESIETEPIELQTPEPLLAEPKTLLTWLDRLNDEKSTRDWAISVRQTVEQLRAAWGHDPHQTVELISQLKKLDMEAFELGATLDPASPVHPALARAEYALDRRVALWSSLADFRKRTDPAGNERPEQQTARKKPENRLEIALTQVHTLTDSTVAGKAWREYLLLESLGQIAKLNENESDPIESRRLAREVLSRMEDRQLDELQRQYLGKQSFQVFQKELSRIAESPIESKTFFDHLERYEETGLPSEGRRLAMAAKTILRDESHPRFKLAQQIDAYYRNANIRILLDEKLVNRLMPLRNPQYKPVNSMILGRPVHGRSKIDTEVSVKLIPDPNRLRFALEIEGGVFSSTTSRSGPILLRNQTRSFYFAQKPVEITAQGVSVWPAEVYFVDSNNRLKGMETPFDGIPLLAPLVHGVVESQHRSKHTEIRRETQWKVASEAKQQFDDEADSQLTKLNERLENGLFATLQRLNLKLTPVETRTTENHLSMRYCLNSDDQLGSHTPRPVALDGSLANIQIHQTMLNNLIEQLDLDGRTFKMKELAQWLSDKLGRPELAEAEEMNARDDVRISFAAKNSVYVETENNQVALTLSIARLRANRKSWKNFQVRVFYRPEIDGLQVRWVRDGVVRLTGRRVRTSSQFALRGIFSRIFSKTRSFPMIPEKFAENPNLEGLAVTQMEIIDGWIGMSIGEEKLAKVELVDHAGSSERR
jgi:hypothetical protein